jgi:hypothetical protein
MIGQTNHAELQVDKNHFLNQYDLEINQSSPPAPFFI